MKRFLTKTGALVGLIIALAFLASLDPTLGLFGALIVSFGGLVGVIHPIHRIGLNSRLFSVMVLLLVGLPALIATTDSVKQQTAAQLAELKKTDPTAYLAKLHDTDKAAWMSELAKMDPARYADVKAAEVAKQSAKLERKHRIEIREATNLTSTMRWDTARQRVNSLAADGVDTTDLRAKLEQIALPMVKGLPADELKANMEGYDFLAFLDRSNGEYPDKVAFYSGKIAQAHKRAIASLKTSRDKVEDVTWYEPANAPRYLNSRSTAYLYIGRNGGNGTPFLRLKVQYTASDWLFVHDVYAWHDGIKEPLVSGPFKRDNNSTIWEWADKSPTGYQIEVMRSLANAKDAILRFEGQQYHRDVTLSAADKRAIRTVLIAYDAMKSGS